MNTGLSANNPTIVSAFQSALMHQALVALVIIVALAIAWNLLRAAQLRSALAVRTSNPDAGTSTQQASAAPASAAPASAAQASAAPVTGPEALTDVEPTARRLLRIGFGLLWIFDGILQAQSSMPLGMTTQVIQPAASPSPGWVRQVVNFGGTIWSDHPIVAATAVVWIQLGIGLWMLVAPRGYWSRASGAASVVWALVVWVLGEAFGGLFAPGLTWLFGAPGAAVFYCAAGVMVALPERHFSSGRMGLVISRAMGVFFLAMAGLQAWPGRGFWVGRSSHSGAGGTLYTMVHEMTGTPQPGAISGIVKGFTSLDGSHAFAVNLAAVIGLCIIGLSLLSARRSVLRFVVPLAVVLCLGDWVLVEDLGFLGGTGTDPNSMIPMALIVIAGYVALTRAHVKVDVEVLDPGLDLPADLDPDVPVQSPPPAETPKPNDPTPRPAWRERVATRPAYLFRALAAGGAVLVVMLGAAPMAVASLQRRADPIVAEAIDGTPGVLDSPAPGFVLTDQFGKPASLSSLTGKVIVLTFLDPVCITDCPIIAQELRTVDEQLGQAASRVEFVAVDANPLYRSVSVLNAFDSAERLTTLTNWLYLTGSVRQLTRVWNSYGEEIQIVPSGGMIAHSDLAFVIDDQGLRRYVLDSDPGPGTQASKASFETVLSGLVSKVLAQP